MNGPFGVAAYDYFRDGWFPIPLPPKQKWPPVDGFTGAHGKPVDERQLRLWLSARGNARAGKMVWKAAGGNIALRLPPNIIGIDVDMYGSKTGRRTLEKAEEQWGKLPDTWYSSSRQDGSGIRLYRIPEGLQWPGKLPQGGGVELVTWNYRYVICAPSIHPDTGQPYMWFRNGEVVVGEIPDLNSIPELPRAWVEGLTNGRKWQLRAAADMDAQEVREWLSARNGGRPCHTMARSLSAALRKVRTAGDDGGAHDAARDGAWGLIGDAASGHSGIEQALAKLRKAFVLAVKDRRGTDGERLANEEWARIVIRGVQKVSAEGEAENEDMCALLGAQQNTSEPERRTGTGDGGTGSAARADRDRKWLYDFTRDDIGNAQRLVAEHRHDMRYCGALGGWIVWDGNRWTLDRYGQVSRWAMEIVRDMDSEAQFIEDPKERAEFMRFIRSSGNISKLRAMVSLAAEQSGMAVPASEFDSNPQLLGCANGTVRMGEDGSVERVPSLPEHRLTLNTGTPYIPDASNILWDQFLKRIQPDPDILMWLQKLVGYSLWGGNPQRLFIVCYGPTSTGKTTFAAAIRSALGDYAGVTNMTVFRDNQDERPRADVAGALPKRFLYAEEASNEWRLHPDQIKRITGGSEIRARWPFAREYIEAVPQFTPWLLTNAPPHVEGADNAFMRRLVVVPFDQQIPMHEEDARYRDRIIEGAREAVLSWCLRGWTMYRQDPDLSTPASALAVRETFQQKLSELDAMLADTCVIGEGLRERPTALWRAYRHWCEQDGSRPMTQRQFWERLDGRGLVQRWAKIDGKTSRVRVGIRLNRKWAELIPEALEG